MIQKFVKMAYHQTLMLLTVKLGLPPPVFRGNPPTIINDNKQFASEWTIFLNGTQLNFSGSGRNRRESVEHASKNATDWLIVNYLQMIPQVIPVPVTLEQINKSLGPGTGSIESNRRSIESNNENKLALGKIEKMWKYTYGEVPKYDIIFDGINKFAAILRLPDDSYEVSSNFYESKITAKCEVASYMLEYIKTQKELFYTDQESTDNENSKHQVSNNSIQQEKEKEKEKCAALTSREKLEKIWNQKFGTSVNYKYDKMFDTSINNFLYNATLHIPDTVYEVTTDFCLSKITAETKAADQMLKYLSEYTD